MDQFNGQGTIGMPRGSTLRIDDGAGALVYVRQGELWLTEEGSTEDHMLGAGHWFRLGRDGAAIVHALSRSAVSLTHAAPSPARRVALTRAGCAEPMVLYQRRRLSFGEALFRVLRPA